MKINELKMKEVLTGTFLVVLLIADGLRSFIIFLPDNDEKNNELRLRFYFSANTFATLMCTIIGSFLPAYL